MNEINISKTLVAKRKERGITQDELAKHMGVSKASVSKWETGQSYPDITFLPQLATYFNISVDELIHYEPQMLEKDIRKLYHRLADDFSTRPFAQVLDEIREYTKKYYSCFPLLFQMGALVINYHTLAEDQERFELIREVMDWFIRIKTECSDAAYCQQAIAMEALCHMLLSEPAMIIDLLDGYDRPTFSATSLLATGYAMLGDTPSSQRILQTGIYQNLLSMLQNLSYLLQQSVTEPEKSSQIIKRIFALVDAFEVEQLHPGFLLPVYLLIAQLDAAGNRVEDALEMLQKYCNLAANGTFPLTLHGDDFFDKIDLWMSEFGIDLEPPRSEPDIKKSILESITQNPVFAPLSENPQYQQIIQTLATI